MLNFNYKKFTATALDGLFRVGAVYAYKCSSAGDYEGG